MSYGLCNSQASFQRLMDMTLSGLAIERILAYVDDICLFSATFSEHMEQLTLVLERLSQSGLALKLSKCHFARDRIDFLGYSLSTNGVQPQNEHLQAVKKFPAPVNKKDRA